jgi:hypothetical protein
MADETGLTMRHVRTSLVVPYASYLRIYEPLQAFAEPARSYWADYAASANGVLAEHRQALANLVSTPPVPVPAHESREAFVARENGATYVCPWETRLRSWVALEELQEGLPDSVIEAFLPKIVVEQAEADFARWQESHGSRLPRILTSTWHVPLWWFVVVAGERRRLVLRGRWPAERSLSYRTPMVEARRRIARALHSLRRTIDDGFVTAGVENLGRWLEEFHPKALVELDYGGLVNLLDDEMLVADRSGEDVAAALAALSRGEPELAVSSYRRLLQRWRQVQAYEHAN